ncbi:hypothetical protein [Caballeronia arationis]|jgi:hypothetical protein|nr:hypothetical protein [Caballeronia arationis]
MQQWRPFLFYCCFLANTAVAASLENREAVQTDIIEAAAANTHFGIEYCDLSSGKASAYRAKVRARVGEPDDFDARWNQGWDGEQETIGGYQKLRVQNPSSFASNVAAACEAIATETESQPWPPNLRE